MEQEFTFDDFKEQEPSSSYINDSIEEIIKKELTEVESFKQDCDDQLLLSDFPKAQFTEIALEYIQGAGDANQVNICEYYSKSGVAIDAWGFNGDDETTTIDLFITNYIDPEEGSRMSASELDRFFNRLIRFYDQAQSGNIFSKIDEKRSDLYQIAELIHKTERMDRIRLFVMTNAIIPSDYEKENIELESGTMCEFYVWDAKRIMRQDDIISGKNPIIVDFEGDYNCTLPCVKMPDVSENVACYLCIIPGIVLSQIYHKYHQQILEMNVRTFLQFKGPSNRGIRDTLIGHRATPTERRKGIGDSDPEPDMFFAYNNGISATATEIELNENGNAITKIKTLQIVNGGQTTAAIDSVFRMPETDKTKLAQVFVAMKISVIKDKDMEGIIVPKISKFANTQSVVKKSDFDINEEFLVELEQQSREQWVLNSSGRPISKWFFERTRGQYLDKANRQSGIRAQRDFYAEYPKSQMFDKTTLSKFMMAWDQNPASVCKGGENNYTLFFEKTKKAGVKFDKTRYQRTIAKAILFKAIDAFYGKEGLQLPGYKSNMVAYTVALLSLASDRSLNLDAIWNEQCVISPSIYNDLTIDLYSVYARLLNGAEHITYKVKETYTDSDGRKKNRYKSKEIPAEEIQLIKTTTLYKTLEYIKTIERFVYNHIMNVNEGENINEWTKTTQCWETLKVKFNAEIESYPIPEEIRSTTGDLDIEITDGQKKVIAKAQEYDASVWFGINSWSKENPGLLSSREQAFMGQVGFAAKRRQTLSYKQYKWALDIYEKAIGAGWKQNKEE